MIFAYPNALFPFVAAELHAPWATGLMFAAPSVGAFGVTVASGWMGRVRRHGMAIAVAAAGWGLAMTGFGLAPDIYLALGALVLARAADMVSGIFRDTLWNQTIPDALRGRVAGVELLSYGVGPPASSGPVWSRAWRAPRHRWCPAAWPASAWSAWYAACCPASPATGRASPPRRRTSRTSRTSRPRPGGHEDARRAQGSRRASWPLSQSGPLSVWMNGPATQRDHLGTWTSSIRHNSPTWTRARRPPQ